MKDRTIFRISLLIVLCAVLAAGYASGAVAETAENLYDYSQIEKWELYPEKFALLSTGAPDGSQAEPEARTINVDYGRTFTLAFADYARYQSDHFYILAGEDKFTEGLKLEGVLYDNGVAFSLSPEQLETVSSNNEKNVWLTVHAADEPCLLIELNRSPADACNTVGFAAILLCDGQGRLIGRPTDAFADDEENVYFMTSPAVGEVAFDLHGTQVPLNQDAANPSLQTLGASMLYGEELTFASPSTLPDMMNYGPDQPLASMTTRIWQKGYEYPRFNNFEEYDSTYGHDEPESTAGNTISLAASETDDLVFNCFDMAGVYTRVDVELGSLGNPDNEGNRLFNG